MTNEMKDWLYIYKINWKRMGKRGGRVMAYFKTLSSHSIEDSKENYKQH
jgi:hypothetical protein